jgi:hypothetical protein
MVDVVESEAIDSATLEPPSPIPLWRRRWLLVCIVAVVVLAVVGVGVGALVYVHTYQPLEPGDFGATGGLHAQPLTDGVADTRIVVIGPTGTQARVDFSVRNNGSHDVRLLGLPANSGVDRIAWGPYVDGNQLLGGTAAEAKPFPMTLRAGHEISLWVYVTQPNCSGGGYGLLSAIPLRWSALGVHHVYDLALNTSPFLPIMNCPPHKALKYIDHF